MSIENPEKSEDLKPETPEPEKEEKEDFDFSKYGNLKSRGQKQFNALPKNAQETLVGEAWKEAMDEKPEGDFEVLSKKEKREFDTMDEYGGMDKWEYVYRKRVDAIAMPLWKEHPHAEVILTLSTASESERHLGVGSKKEYKAIQVSPHIFEIIDANPNEFGIQRLYDKGKVLIDYHKDFKVINIERADK